MKRTIRNACIKTLHSYCNIIIYNIIDEQKTSQQSEQDGVTLHWYTEGMTLIIISCDVLTYRTITWATFVLHYFGTRDVSISRNNFNACECIRVWEKQP